MKKIAILLFFIFSATACYDYKELNNLAIISGIALDYNDNQYEIMFEILNDDKVSEDLENKNKTYYVSGKGNTMTDAFNNAGLEINKVPYYSHIQTMIISKEVAENHSSDFIDFFVRNSYITNMFYMVIAKDTDASTILQSTSTENRIVSESIYTLIDNKDLGNSLSIKVNMEYYTSLFANPMQDIYLPTVAVEDDILKLRGIAIFNQTKMKEILDFNQSQTLNILFNENKNAYYQVKCDDNKYTIIDVYKQKISFDVTKHKVKVNLDLMAKIEENQCNYNLKDQSTYKKLQKQFNKVVDDDVLNLFSLLKENNADVLGINYMYYKDHNDTLKFNKLNFEVNTNISVNKNGLIFEVNHDNK